MIALWDRMPCSLAGVDVSDVRTASIIRAILDAGKIKFSPSCYYSVQKSFSTQLVLQKRKKKKRIYKSVLLYNFTFFLAVPWLRWLVTGLLARTPAFASGCYHVRSLALGRFCPSPALDASK
jgi:hypothetical protein